MDVTIFVCVYICVYLLHLYTLIYLCIHTRMIFLEHLKTTTQFSLVFFLISHMGIDSDSIHLRSFAFTSRGRNLSKVWQRIKDNLEGQTHPSDQFTSESATLMFFPLEFLGAVLLATLWKVGHFRDQIVCFEMATGTSAVVWFALVVGFRFLHLTPSLVHSCLRCHGYRSSARGSKIAQASQFLSSKGT